MTPKLLINCSFVLSLVLMSASCAKTPVMEKEGDIIYPEFRIRVSEMTMSAETRASAPMSPDDEKYVTSLAIIEFDKEGLHVKSDSTYHFINFLDGTVDGVEGVGNVKKTDFGVAEFNLKGMKFKVRPTGTICFIANVTEQQVIDYYKSCSQKTGGEFGHMTLEQLQDWALPFIYKESPVKGVYDESVLGHLKTMYMFGYYYGPISAENETLAINLGRLASRLDVAIVNETGERLTERFGYNFNNVCDSAYFFPMKKSMPPAQSGQTRNVICSGNYKPIEQVAPGTVVPKTFGPDSTHTRYFYVAAHSAKNEEEATKLHLYYNIRIGSDLNNESGQEYELINPDAEGRHIMVPLCNIQPSEAGSVLNGYSLSRNTRYRFTIRLKKSASSPASTKSGSSAGSSSEPAIKPGDTPGEYILYLP